VRGPIKPILIKATRPGRARRRGADPVTPMTISKFDWYCTDMGQWLAYIYNRFDDEGLDSPEDEKTMLRCFAELVRWHPNPKDLRDAIHRMRMRAARWQARCGNLEPLRKLVPGAEDCIREPPRLQGQTQLQRRQAAHRERLARGVKVADRLRDLFRHDFGRSQRHIKPTAVELAARLTGVDGDELAKAMKHLKRGFS
jgi:hypothetical protein